MNRYTGFLVCVIAVFLSGCATALPFKFPDGPKNTPPPQYQKIERRTVTPQVVKVVNPDGSTAVSEIAYREEYQYDVNATPPAQVKAGFVLLNPFTWPLWLWVFIAVLLFVPGAWGIFTWLLGRVRRRMSQVVRGVEDFLKSDAPDEVKKKLLASLSSATDVRTKKEVADLKLKS